MDHAEIVETFRNMLMSYATGGTVSNDEYQKYRRYLLEDAGLRDRLPRFVRTCSDLKQFWPFIQGKSPSYRGRREYLTAEFAPLLAALEHGPAPADAHVAETVATLNSEAVVQSWRDALDRRFEDPDGAITSARTLLEAVCKHLLRRRGVSFDEAADLPKLYRLATESIALAPSQQTEPILRQVAGGCTAVVEGIGAMRNKLGDAHGRGPFSAGPDVRHAELAVNLAGALAVFLIRTWEAAETAT
jgi:hypothetical protein